MAVAATAKRVAMTLLLAALTTAAWAQSVNYIDADGTTQTCTTYTTLSSETTWTGWYVADGTVEITSRVTANGEAHLILKDGATLTIPKGITVTEGNSLTIYGQSGGTGQLTIASPESGYAGIGAYVTDKENRQAANTGTITINGGTIDVKGGTKSVGGAAIGGAYWGNTGTITINGGHVTAAAQWYGAGIGSCTSASSGGTITITGGTIVATSPAGAGIGGAFDAVTPDIYISGGNVTATSTGAQVGIGAGSRRSAHIITISGGTITATGGDSSPGIGGGSARGVGTIPGNCGTVTISGGTVTATGGDGAPGIGGGCAWNADSPGADGGTIIITGGNVTAHGTHNDTFGDGYGIGHGYPGKSTNLTADIRLSWTEAGNSITAEGYKGAVTLQKPFDIEGEGTILPAGEVANVSTLAGKTLVPHFVYALSGTNVGFYVGSNEVTEAAEGETVTVSANADAIAALSPRQYFTGAYSTSDVTLTTGEYDATFTMPAKAVTVSAVLAEQTEATIDLTSATPQTIDEGLWLLLTALEGYAYYDNGLGCNVIDVNRDGTADVKLTDDNKVTRLQELTANYRFTLRYEVVSPYATVLFKFTAAGETQEQPVIEPLFDEYDNETTIAAWAADGKTHNVMLDGRTLYKDGKWNTLCLPFNVTVGSDVMAGATAMTLNGETSGFNTSTGELTLNFTSVTSGSTIAAGTPFIAKWTGSNLTDPVFCGVTVSSTTAGSVTSTDGYVTFVGTYKPEPIFADPAINLYLGADNTLYYPTATDFKVNSFRAYFELGNGLTCGTHTSQVRAFSLSFGDENDATGIRSMDNGQWIMNNCWYDISGRKLLGKPTQRGIYIYNGNKVVIK